MTNVVKFPYNACRRVHSRKPRISKNGTPEERAAKAAVGIPTTQSPTNVVQIRKPARPYTPPSEEEKATFRALLDQLPPSDLPWVSALMRSLMDKTCNHPRAPAFTLSAPGSEFVCRPL